MIIDTHPYTLGDEALVPAGKIGHLGPGHSERRRAPSNFFVTGLVHDVPQKGHAPG
jgi:hypothetical protein